MTFLSWNLCLLENSNQAPSDWRIDQTESEIRKLVLDLDPDFVFFQELPGMVPFVETHDLVPANTTSHSGSIATIAKHHWMDQLTCQAAGRFAVLTSIESAGVSFANVHLPPGSSGIPHRKTCVERLTQLCPTPELIIVGDTNTRTHESDSFAPLGLTGKLPPLATWNSQTNRFHDNGKRYTAYYTRFFHTAGVSVSAVKVWNQPLVRDNRKFHLSDHFPLSGTVTTTGEDMGPHQPSEFQNPSGD